MLSGAPVPFVRGNPDASGMEKIKFSLQLS